MQEEFAHKSWSEKIHKRIESLITTRPVLSTIWNKALAPLILNLPKYSVEEG
jgi:hypothetical protein